MTNADASEPEDTASSSLRVSRRRLLKGTALAVVGAAAGGAAVTWHDRRTPSVSVSTLQDRSRAISDEPLGDRHVLFNVATDSRAIALTFDDGPTEAYTATVLDILAAAEAKATFNCVGANVAARPGLVRKVQAGGHEIGNHSWEHEVVVLDEVAAARSSIERTDDAIEAAIGVRTQWFRPARGEITGTLLVAAAATGHDTLMWSYGGRLQDPRSSPASHVDAFMQAATPGMICGYHDGLGAHEFKGESDFKAELRAHRNSEIAALPEILHAATTAGYEFVTVTELLSRASR